ncbi:hypothetical protein [Lysobacter gummosus]|uniref:hypothetical protein n=1 Tax=Lysobacter gummosus TaxID=262324 RepID=UPI00363B0CA4
MLVASKASKEPDVLDRNNQICALPPTVIPANAGIQRLQAFSHERHWIPAFAGMTSKKQKPQARARARARSNA